MSLRSPACPIALLALAALGPASAAAAPAPAHGFRIAVEEPGVYAVGYEDLVEAGLGAAFLRSAALAATRDGEPVAIWVEDGGDGRLGPGDHVELVAGRPAGERTWHHPYSTEAVYLLGVSRRPSPRLSAGALRAAPAGGSASAPAKAARAGLLARRHFEEDRLFLRFSGESVETAEVWYWARLTPLEPEPLSVTIGLSDLDPAAPEPVTLRIGVRGWSRLPDPRAAGLTDHRLEVGFAGRPLATVEWDNREGGFVVEPPALAAAALGPGEHELTLAIAPRSLPGGDPVVDVVALDWIEVDYPRRPRVGRAQARFESAAGAAGDGVELAAPAAGLTLYTDAGERLAGAAAPSSHDGGDDAGGGSRYRLPPGADLGGGFWAVPDGGLRRPSSVRPLRGAGLRDRDRRADYLIVVHPRLRWQIEPLAGAHRRRGLAVEVVDVEAVYDQFGGGVEHPRAIRDFLAYARESWRPPAPRFVLLAGDASWDTKNVAAERHRYADRPYLPGRGATIGSHRFPTYSERASHNYRGLVPTGSSATHEGHAASDARLAMLDGDRWPDLAIGRLPAATPAEAAAMVAKTLRYLERPRVGPWRRDVLWVSDGEPYLDGVTDRLARALADRGFAASKVRPEPADPDPAARRARLLAAIDRGPLVVHFIGHGGRNIWRTGRSSEVAQSDLFTLADLDRLSPADRLPVVLSMSCYSAPFDHPNADSIGEKFLRLADRGAVAVIAASWRNVPTETMSRMLTDELTRPGATIGEALLFAKRRSHSTDFIEQYNLLGDPALPLQLPGPLAVREAAALDGRPAVIADLRALPFRGRALVEWRDRAGELLERREYDDAGPDLVAAFPGDPRAAARLGWAQVYLWNAERGLDALGGTEIHPPPPPARIAGRAGGRDEPTPPEIPR